MTAPAIRNFVFAEGLTFVAAALVHFGVLMHAYEHLPAGTAESVIGSVLLIGFASAWIFPKATRAIALAVQAFALFGTAVGITTIAIGIGPRTVPDITYHVVISIALICGIGGALRRHSPSAAGRHS